MKHQRIPSFLALLDHATGPILGLGLLACGSEPPAPTQDDTDSNGIVTTGLGGQGSDAADETSADSVDESGGGDGGGVAQYCIYSGNEEGIVGIKHQCAMEYELTISFMVDPPIGDSFERRIVGPPVQTLNDSTYERPFVMACCSDITEHPSYPFADSCDAIHHKACFSDFIEHICAAPGAWLSRAALDHTFEGQEAIEAAASWLNAHRNDCYSHFWFGPDALHSTEPCSPELDGSISHTPWEPGRSWSYEILGQGLATVSDVRVAPRSWLGTDVPQAPPSPAESCTLPDGNNGVAPPFPQEGEIGGTLVSPIAPAPIQVDGPELAGEDINGGGELGEASELRWASDAGGSLVISRWLMTEHEAAEVGTPSWSASVEHFELELIGMLRATPVGGVWRTGAHGAAFNVGVKVNGVMTSVQAVNTVPIELQVVTDGSGDCPSHAASCLVTGPFTIAHEDSLGQQWRLDVPSVTWSP